MANLITITKSTRGKNAREIEFQGVGKYVTRTIDRETDAEGNPLPKDENGKQIVRPEEVSELETEGALSTIDEALELVGNDMQKVLDYFAFGFNDAAYRAIADRDELDELLSDITDSDKRDALKRAIRQVARATGQEVSDAAVLVLSGMKK
jgi:hypothetical protein